MLKSLFSTNKKTKHPIKNIGKINLLTPKIFPKEKAKIIFKQYFEKLHNAIYSDDATNIAITGSYGSGKTTIIKNYQNVFDTIETGREYLNISLATFKEETDKDVETQNKDKSKKIIDSNLTKEKNKSLLKIKEEKQNLERLIELSILQQILYHVEPSVIPNSNLKRIRSLTSKFLFWFTFLSIVWLFSTTILFKFDHISKVNPYTWNSVKPIDWFIVILTLIFTGGLYYLIHKGIRLLSSTKISKLKFFEGELELGGDANKSILNEHIDEIIYFFQKTKYDVVIFEDIDRFENTEIFTKLREVNQLLNKSKLIKRELNKIVFIYAVRDDKFKNEERTKFFDYIIPVIPFVSPTNANEQLWKLIKQEGLKDMFTKNFIDDVITFIDDIEMRLLTNIFNEFLIYKSKVLTKDNNKERNNNLLAIVIYKNLHPKDFSELSQRKGFMFEIINKKKYFIEEHIKVIDLEIKELQEKQREINNETILVKRELRAIYITAIHEIITNISQIIINSKVYNLEDLIEEDIFEDFMQQDKIEYNFYKTYNNNLFIKQSGISDFSFSDLEKAVSKEYNFGERTNLIDDKYNSKKLDIKRQIQDFKTKKIGIESWDLSEIFQELNIKPDTSKFENSRLIKYLLLDGYINENYSHYISLFHEENLTNEDFDFERKVKSGENSPFNFELKRIYNLVNKIDIRYFGRPVSLNFDLLNYLLDNQSKEKDKLNRFFKQLSNENPRVIEFIDEYIKNEELKISIKTSNKNSIKSTNIESFVKILSKNWVRFWDFIYLDSNYTDEKIRKYITYIIQYSDIEDLVFFTNGGNINTYIMQQRDFLTFFSKDYHQKVKKTISALNTSFETLGHSTDKTKELFQYIYENNHYKINLNNISVLLETFHKDKSVSGINGVLPDDFTSNNYETILNSGCTHLIDYINENFTEYVKKAYLKTEIDNEEKETILSKYFFNNNSLDLDLKIKIIKELNTIINKLVDIEEIVIKDELFRLNKVKASWSNILHYLTLIEDKEVIPEIIIDFYNNENNHKELSKNRIASSSGHTEEFYKSINKSIILSNKLNIEAYKDLIKSTGYIYHSLEFEDLESEKVQVLIDKSKLTLTEDNYDKLRDVFPEKHIALIENYQSKFMDKISSFTLNETDYAYLFDSKKIKNANKLKLLKKITVENLKTSEKLSRVVSDYVLISKNLTLNINMLSNIISHNLPTDSKVNLITLYCNQLTNQEIVKLITLLPRSYSKIATKSQTTIPKNSINLNFIKSLENKGFIGTVKENKRNEYRLYMNKF